MIERQNPSYPEQELRRGGEGWVAMSFMVSETGAVTDAMVESSNVLVHLDDLARRSQQTWTVPTSFGSCRVFLKGDPGATFELYEFPDAAGEPADAAPPASLD